MTWRLRLLPAWLLVARVLGGPLSSSEIPPVSTQSALCVREQACSGVWRRHKVCRVRPYQCLHRAHLWYDLEQHSQQVQGTCLCKHAAHDSCIGVIAGFQTVFLMFCETGCSCSIEGCMPWTGPAARVRRRGSTGALLPPFMRTKSLERCRVLRLFPHSLPLSSSSCKSRLSLKISVP